MFQPEPNDLFHVYHEEHGLFLKTVYRCTDKVDGNVVAVYEAGDKPKIHGTMLWKRGTVSFWPVQPGLVEHLRGEKRRYDRFEKCSTEFLTAFRGVVCKT
jgi:hypothetical protein